MGPGGVVWGKKPSTKNLVRLSLLTQLGKCAWWIANRKKKNSVNPAYQMLNFECEKSLKNKVTDWLLVGGKTGARSRIRCGCWWERSPSTTWFIVGCRKDRCTVQNLQNPVRMLVKEIPFHYYLHYKATPPRNIERIPMVPYRYLLYLYFVSYLPNDGVFFS